MDKSYRIRWKSLLMQLNLPELRILNFLNAMENRCVRKKVTEKEVITQILRELRVQPDGYETAAVLTITDQEAWKMAAILKKRAGR